MEIKKKLFSLLTMFLTLDIVTAVTSITLVSNYGTENYLLALYCVLIFIFWIVIYRISPEFKFDKNNLVKTITGVLTKTVCWIWFLGTFYIFQSILLISSSSSFLEGKLAMFTMMLYISMGFLSFVGIINAIKVFKGVSGVENFFKELNFEIKTGGRK